MYSLYTGLFLHFEVYLCCGDKGKVPLPPPPHCTWFNAVGLWVLPTLVMVQNKNYSGIWWLPRTVESITALTHINGNRVFFSPNTEVLFPRENKSSHRRKSGFQQNAENEGA